MLQPSQTPAPDFQLLFQSVPGLFLVLLPDLRITAVSDAYLAATKTKREDIIGHGIFDIFPDNPDDPDASGVANLRASLLRALNNKVPDAMAVQKYDIQLPESEGGGFQEKYWSPLNSPVLNEKNEVMYIMHRVEDITEFILLKKKDAELENRNEEMESEIYMRAQQIQDANKKLREAERLKSEFFANVSHELRTPLSLIFAPLESLLSGKYGEISERQQKFLQIIDNNAIRLLQMVNGLLDFSKFEAGKMKAEPEPTDVSQLIRAVLNDFESALNGKKVKLTSELNVEGKPLMIDRYLFERILFNLVSNAGKFTKEGGKVIVRSSLKDGLLKVSVEDTGIGISEKDLENLFQKFRQAEGSSTRRYEGTGLGLAMVKEFSELLGGAVAVKSEPGVGSIFTVELPVQPAEMSSKDVQPITQRRMLIPMHKNTSQIDDSNQDSITDFDSNFDSKMKVLVCEDNDELSAYIVSLLNDFCTVKRAKDGEEGLQLVESWMPDLVLSDIMMPKVDGITVCETIKSNPKTSKIVVVLLTALTHREAMIKGWKAKADEYLFKPFHPEELIIRIKSLLSVITGRKKAEEEIMNLNESLKEKIQELEQFNKELETFSYSVSHDLRAPVRAINGYMKLYLEEYSDKFDDESKRLTGRIMENAIDMGRLIDDLLEFFRMGKKELATSKVQMKDLVNDVFKNLSASETGRNIKLKVNELPAAEADIVLMKQVWTNLISNAIKYTRKSENAVIEIGASPDDSDVVYYVKDNGVGFSMEYYNKLFGIFQRLHSPEEFEGTGIGLSIVERIISKHKGKIWAEGKPDEGATFYFSLNSNN